MTITTPTNPTPTPAPRPRAVAQNAAAATEEFNANVKEAGAKVESFVSDTQKTLASSFQDATGQVESFVADTQKTLSDRLEKFTKGFEGMTAFGQENLDAFVKSSEIAAKAAEGINSEISAYSKKSFEHGIAAVQDLASAKTVTELFEKQTAFAQSAFEGFVSQATKMNEIYVAAAKDITAPLGARVTAATEKLRSLSAA